MPLIEKQLIMRNLLGLLLFCFILASCGGDSCSEADYVGSWSGTISCDTEPTEDIDIVITEGSGGNINLDIDGEITPVEVNGCSLNIPEISIDFFGTPLTTSGSGNLDGDALTIVQKISVAGVEESCTINLTR